MKSYLPVIIILLSTVGLLTLTSRNPTHESPIFPASASPIASSAASVSHGPAHIAETPADVRVVFPEIQKAPGDWSAFIPSSLTVAVYPDLKIPLHIAEAKIVGGRTVTIYQNPQLQAFLVAAATPTEYIGTLTVPEAGSFEITIKDQSVSIKPLERAACESAGILTSSTEAPEALAAQDAGTQTYLVDVVFLYNDEALALAGNSEETLDTRYIAHLEAANNILTNSQVNNFRWRYVGGYTVPHYATNALISNDLKMLTDTTTEVSKQAQAHIAETGAELAVLVCGSGRTPYQGMNSSRLNAIICNGDPILLAHELAHGFGCQHDRDTVGAKDNSGIYSYGYYNKTPNLNFGTVMSYKGTIIPYFSNPDITYKNVPTGIPASEPRAADNARTLRENASRIANLNKTNLPPSIVQQPANLEIDTPTPFAIQASGDNLTYQWFLNGTLKITTNDPNPSVIFLATDDFFGTWYVVVSNSLGSVKTNTFTLSKNNAPHPPQITAQTQTITVAEGETFTLQIEATGQNNTYYWQKNGVNIPGANSSTFQKAAAMSDQGSYVAGVYNTEGSTTSAPISVTVTSRTNVSTPVTAPSTGGGSGNSSDSGSGGGGAVSFWFYAAIGAVALLKRRAQC